MQDEMFRRRTQEAQNVKASLEQQGGLPTEQPSTPQKEQQHVRFSEPTTIGEEEGLSSPYSPETVPSSSSKANVDVAIDQERQGQPASAAYEVSKEQAQAVEQAAKEETEGLISSSQSPTSTASGVRGRVGNIKDKAAGLVAEANNYLDAAKTRVGIPAEKPLTEVAREAVSKTVTMLKNATAHTTEQLSEQVGEKSHVAQQSLAQRAQAVKDAVVTMPTRIREVHAHGLKLAEEKDMMQKKKTTEGPHAAAPSGANTLDQPDVSDEYYQAGVKRQEEEKRRSMSPSTEEYHQGAARDAATGEPVTSSTD